MPARGQSYIFTTALLSQANTKVFQTTPTLATGDVKVKTDNGSYANIGTLPTVSGPDVIVTLSAAEMNGEDVVVKFVDAAGAEWCDSLFRVKTDGAGAILQSTTNWRVSGTTITIPSNATMTTGRVVRIRQGTASELRSIISAANNDGYTGLDGTVNVSGADLTINAALVGTYTNGAVAELIDEVGNYADTALRPTVSGRTLDVSAAGNAGIDWANIENNNGLQHLDNTFIGQVITLGQNSIVPGVFFAGSITSTAFATGVFPTNFATMLINGSGHVSRVTLVDSVTNGGGSGGNKTIVQGGTSIRQG